MASASRNILDWYAQADEAQRAAGLDWYPEADALAARIADATGGRVSHRQACAVIAVLSPRVSWPDNKRAALVVVNAWARGERVRGLPGVYGANIDKAYRVLDGPADPAVCDGCRKSCCAVHGPKVAAFYRAIAGLADDGAMDVWAIRAATVHPMEAHFLAADDPRRYPEALTPAQSRKLAAAYRRAAARAGIPARSLQAVVWLTVRSCWTKSNGVAFSARADIPF